MKNMFSKKFKSDILCLTMVVVALVTFFALNFVIPNKPVEKVKAETVLNLSDDTEITKSSGLYQLGDEELYFALIDAYNFGKQENERISKLYVGTFKSTTSLNLSNKNIKRLSGLAFFKFDSLKTLDLSNNQLTQSFGSFENMLNLEELNLSYNQLTSIDCSFSTSIKNVDLSHNELTSCNLSTLNVDGYANISFNKLADFSKLILPQTNATIFATHNLLTQDVPSNLICTLNLGFQGGLSDVSLTKSSVIRFYSLDGVLKIDIYKTDENGNLIGSEPYKSLTTGETLTNFPIAYYKIVFDEGEVSQKSYQDISIACRPLSPQFKLFIDGKQTEEELHIIKQIATLKMEAEGDVYYTVNGGEITNGNEITFKNAGSYTVICWQKIDGMNSEKVTYLVISKYVAPLTFVWIFLGVVFFVIFFYIGKIWSNHAGSLSKKEGTGKKGFNWWKEILQQQIMEI